MIGQRFGRLVIVQEVWSNPKHHSRKFLCKCDCGTEKEILKSNIIRGKSISCGCFRAEKTGNQTRTHGLSKTTTHLAWENMRRRCFDPRNKAWHNYGGRGITICERWGKFANFLADMGVKPFDSAQIDRINNNGNYEPENCRWLTPSENCRNKRDAIMLSI